jgi:hypothetical protein
VKPTQLTDNLIFTTVRVEAEVGAGVSTGTAFCYLHKHAGQDIPLLVTNKHVIAGAKVAHLFFHTGDGEAAALGKSFRLDVSEFDQMWSGHPNADVDVAVAPLNPLLEAVAKSGVKPFLRWADPSMLPSSEQLAGLSVLEEVVFIGYPNGIWDTTNYLPIVRYGRTATLPHVNFKGLPQFVIDASVFPGSSGSPVFLYNNGSYSDGKGGLVIGSRILLLGLVSSVFVSREEYPVATAVPVPHVVTQQMLDLGIVFAAGTIAESATVLMKKHGL